MPITVRRVNYIHETEGFSVLDGKSQCPQRITRFVSTGEDGDCQGKLTHSVNMAIQWQVNVNRK